MWFFRWIALAIVILAVLLFALQNQGQMIQVKILKWETSPMPLYLALFGAFVVGMLAFLLISIGNQVQTLSELSRERRKHKKSEAKVRELQQELEQTGEELKKARLQQTSLENKATKTGGESTGNPPAKSD